MNDLKNRVRPDWREQLESLLSRAAGLGSRAVFAFDLDSTLFDNLPRQARIVREFGRERGAAALTRCAPAHFTSGWDLKAAMGGCGLPQAEIEQLFPELRRFWRERFFTSDYCLDDVAIPGAPHYVQQAAATGAMVCYVTGRHEQMRPGTEQTLRRDRFPAPDGVRVRLLMKPTFDAHDDDYKKDAHRQLAELGELVAAFDNEPTHVNDYRRRFPSAAAIHLATDHSGRPVELLDGIVSVPHF